MKMIPKKNKPARAFSFFGSCFSLFAHETREEKTRYPCTLKKNTSNSTEPCVRYLWTSRIAYFPRGTKTLGTRLLVCLACSNSTTEIGLFLQIFTQFRDLSQAEKYSEIICRSAQLSQRIFFLRRWKIIILFCEKDEVYLWS